ncbi:leucine zipper protein 1 S homeolog [Xenopus laevis]|uniref:Leucine zipper protein 1 S homeolog n=1 Tax=Xenopus laevis TaxID=8355 RepID=Q6DE43_XENLA|nr:leucine zipper protein 1 S homeolog [Xenopus laevis]AAH77301.1 Luzp1-prov protein [Xenopus laevis]
MEHTSRHLRFKLQSLNRRLDDLEEATRNLQKAEDEVLELQDKIVQVEGSNSSMLADVDALRKRVVKIEGKDEEVKKAEDLCRLVREKLENEENVTRELRSEIEILQKKMTELEKLEEAFSKSKNDCTQLCLGLNEEKNMSKKLTSELETLRARIKELESSESKLDKAEEFLTSEIEKIRSLAVGFATEKKYFLEKEKQNEKLILELKQQLELKGKKKIGDQTRNESNVLEQSSDQFVEHKIKIEDNLISKLSQGVGFDYVKSMNQTTSENERNKQQEDNKIKDLCQEIEKLKSQIKQFEGVEEELKQLREKNGKLQEIFISERNKARHLDDELQALKRQGQHNEVENGVISSDEISLHSKLKNERANKSKGVTPELPVSKYTQRDLSPKQLRKERHRDLDVDIYSKRHLSSTNSKRPLKPALSDMTISHSRKSEDRLSSNVSAAKEIGALHEIKKAKDQPSVLSRYPPAAQEHNQKTWKTSTGNKDLSTKQFGEDYSIKFVPVVDNTRKESASEEDEDLNETPGAKLNANLHEEMQSDENSSSALHSEPVTSGLEATSPDKYTAKMVEIQTKTALNSDTNEIKETISQDRPSRYSRLKSRMDSTTNSSDTAQSTKQLPSKDEKDLLGNQNLNSTRVSYNRERQRPLSSLKPQIPEKPHISESTENKEWDKRNVTSRIQNRRQSNPKEKTPLLEHRISQYGMDSQHQQDSFSEISRRTSSDNSENMDKPSRIEIRARSYSPREALQSTVIIKPVIVEKDRKESMGEYRARSSGEHGTSQENTTTNKVTSSITFFPTESPSSRSNTDEIIKQRHTSTSNIRLSANDQPLSNNISIPYVFDMLKLVDTKDDLNHKENSKAFDSGNLKEQMKNNNNSVGLESVLLNSQEIEGNHLDNKSVKGRCSYGRNVFGSTEELDILSNHKDVSMDTKHRRRSAFEDERPGKLRAREIYSKNRNSFENSCTVNDIVPKRSFSAMENTARRHPVNESGFSSGPASWNRLSTEREYSYSSRRKANNHEKLSKVDASGNKSRQHQTSMVEERIRRLEQ